MLLPIPHIPTIATRAATMSDLPFMDALQRRHSKMVGYFPTKQFEGYIAAGQVLVAVGATPASPESSRVTRAAEGDAGVAPTGYIIAKDRYLKRDELGVVYQLNVAPGAQRKLIGATLLRAVFERAAYGCRLFCCWCAQDIDANRFWEAMGFVPLAFRAGSTGKKRLHIFWQRRIDAGDETTPYWYPFQTNSGAIRQDRLVFPIPPGVDWREVRAVELACTEPRASASGRPLLKAGSETRKRQATGRHLQITPPGKVGIFVGGRIKYVDRPGSSRVHAAETTAPQGQENPAKKTGREKAPPPKFDPKHLSAARELRDRWLERVNASEGSLLPRGKYEMGRAVAELATAGALARIPCKALPQAA